MNEKPMYEPCPICGSSWNIKREKSLTKKLFKKSLFCDKCAFYGPKAITWWGAGVKWNGYAKDYAEGLELVKEKVMPKVDDVTDTLALICKLRERASWIAFSTGADEQYPNTDAQLMREAAETIMELLRRRDSDAV